MNLFDQQNERLEHFKLVADKQAAKTGKPMQVVYDDKSYEVYPTKQPVDGITHRCVYRTDEADIEAV